MKTKILLFTTTFFICGVLFGQIIHVPADQPTIQAGINAASDGDTVLVAEDTYYENIRFMGKAITVASEYIMDGDSNHIVNTIIDGSQAAEPDSAATVLFIHGEDTTSIINGFTITGGSGVMYMTYVVRAGGGIFAYNSGCKIMNNIIKENHVEDEDKAGANGIACVQDQGDYWVCIRDNYIGFNTAIADGLTAFGGGMAIQPNCYIENNLIEYNTCTNTGGATDGGGIELEAFAGIAPVAYVYGNIIRYNQLEATTHSVGGGIIVNGFGSAEISNNIIEDNTIVADEHVHGGGIRCANIPGAIIIDNNFISSNTLNGGISAWGAGISVGLSDNIDISYNTINGNLCNQTTEQAGGAGIDLLKCGKSNIHYNEIFGNTLSAGTYAWGGGIFIDKAKDTVLINNNIISDNSSEGIGRGGGISIYNETDSIIYFVNSNKVFNNYSDNYGGGVCARNTYRIYFANNHFKGNESDNSGGAIRFYQIRAKNGRDELSKPVIVNNNFINNMSTAGGAIHTGYDQEVPIIFNSIFWENTANSGQDIYNSSGNSILLHNNNIDTSKISTAWDGENNINCHPSLKNDSLHLDWSSLCVNSGIESLTYADETYYCPEEDIDGDERPYESTLPDIGADEAQWMFVSNFENVSSDDVKLSVFPNPIFKYAHIQIELSESANIQIEVINSQGELIENILARHLNSGTHALSWDAKSLPIGVYQILLKSDAEIKSVKVLKMK